MSRKGDFTDAQKREIKQRADGRCQECGDPGVDCDHIHAIALGGRGDLDNGRHLCSKCHKRKSREDVAAVAKINRITGKTKSQWAGRHRGKGSLSKPPGYKTAWPSQKMQSRPFQRKRA